MELPTLALPLPWQSKQWQLIVDLIQQQRMPHATLLRGQKGLGKNLFAHACAKLLLCEQATHNACERCKACLLLRAQTHPDLHYVTLEDESQVIRIEQIRALIDFANQSSQQGRCKVIIIEPADAMNVAAANALLKTLEEAARNTFIILVSHQIHLLPATILSRCQSITFSIPEMSIAKQWLIDQMQIHNNELDALLAIAEGAPLTVIELINNPALIDERNLFLKTCIAILMDGVDPIEHAQKCSQLNIQLCLEWLLSLFIDILRIKFAGEKIAIANTKFYSELNNLSKKISLQKLFIIIDRIQENYQQLLHKVNLNSLLLLESLLCDLREN